MELLDMATELIKIHKDITRRRRKLEEFVIHDFDQTWASTALGFGGSALTTARTYVLIPYHEEKAYVYYGTRFAYECGINGRLYEDIKKHDIASVQDKGRYDG